MWVSRRKGRVAALCLAAGLIQSGTAKADPAAYNGTWQVSLVSNGGLICSLIPGLRVCPGTSCGIAKPSQHEADRGKAEEGERLAVEVLPILGQSTAAVQPSYGAFDNPALR